MQWPRIGRTFNFVVLASCTTSTVVADHRTSGAFDERQQPNVRAIVYALADDSMQGRRTGTEGARRAATYISGRMEAIGLIPAGASGYFQWVPLGLRRRPDMPPRFYSLESWEAFERLPFGDRFIDANVVGVLRGSGRFRGDGFIILAAHYDHHGVGEPVDGDSIWNGADDNASGVATVLDVARVLSAGPHLRRSVIFLLTTGEESGLLGAAWYVRNPIAPLHQTRAVLAIEMTGRPDPLGGGIGKAWLTGDPLSTMGALFRKGGLRISPDPRPAERFFERSDNIVFARAGIPAHTLSSFGLHADYHQPADEPSKINIEHLTSIAQMTAAAVRLLADGPPPVWLSQTLEPRR